MDLVFKIVWCKLEVPNPVPTGRCSAPWSPVLLLGAGVIVGQHLKKIDTPRRTICHIPANHLQIIFKAA